GEAVHCRKGGSDFPVYMSTSRIFDEESRVAAIVCVAQVLTERKKADEALRLSQEQLQVSQRMESIGRLAGGIAHDFNNLLTIVVGWSDLILQRLSNNDKLWHEIDGIRQAGQRAAELTRKLLAFSRSQILLPRVLDLNSILWDMEKLIRHALSEDIDIQL